MRPPRSWQRPHPAHERGQMTETQSQLAFLSVQEARVTPRRRPSTQAAGAEALKPRPSHTTASNSERSRNTLKVDTTRVRHKRTYVGAPSTCVCIVSGSPRGPQLRSLEGVRAGRTTPTTCSGLNMTRCSKRAQGSAPGASGPAGESGWGNMSLPRRPSTLQVRVSALTCAGLISAFLSRSGSAFGECF
jgi:hypothetical protein